MINSNDIRTQQLRPNARRPVLSVRRRLTTQAPEEFASAAAVATALDTGSTIIETSNGVTSTTSNNNKSNYNSKTFIRSRTRPTFPSANATNDTSATSDRPSTLNEANYTPRIVIRRKFARPISRRTTKSTSASGTDDDEDETFSTTSEPVRTTNPLFKRRLFSTTPSPTSLMSPSTIQSPSTDNLPDDDIDQEAGSSILVDSKFTNNRFNQIGEHLEDESEAKLVDAIKTMSKAPPPVAVTTAETAKNDVHKEGLTRRIGVLKYSTTVAPTTPLTPITTRRTIARRPQKTTTTPVSTATPDNSTPVLRRRKPQKPEPFEKVNSRQFAGRTYRPVIDYDYYDDEDVRFVSKSNSQVKVILHGHGIIECLDQGNFPHPLSCKKFISCAKMEIGGVVGWEYTCPKGLSYDPVGGICNWAAGLGCKE